MNVYVERTWRRKGVAALLMDRVLALARGVLALARGAGLGVITLHASDEERPRYLQLGSTPTNELRLR